MKKVTAVLLVMVVAAMLLVAVPAMAKEGAVTLRDGTEMKGNVQFLYRKAGFLGIGAEETSEEYLEGYLLGQRDRIRVDFKELKSIMVLWPTDDKWKKLNDEDIPEVAVRVITLSQAPLYMVATDKSNKETIYRVSGYLYNTKFINEIWVRHSGADIDRCQVFSSGGALFAPPKEEQVTKIIFKD